MNDEGVRRLATAGALVCLVVVGVAIAAHPHGGGTSWLIVLAAVAAAAVLLRAALALLLRAPVTRTARPPVERGRAQIPWPMLAMAAVLGLLAWALDSIHLGRPKPLPPPPAVVRSAPPTLRPQHPSSGGGFSYGPWVALALGLLVLAVLVAVALQHLRERRRTAVPETLPATPDPLAMAVEAALLDLENEDDPRRAVIKAYASTEQVLRDQGLARLPAEAPMEYLDRVLRGLGARAGAVDRLTELFEHAAFSTHDVDGRMRAEAVAAFHGLRDTLAAPRSAS